MTTMTKRHTTEELRALPVLHQGQADDCHIDTGTERIWLSRTGLADGEPYENTVTHERLIDGTWVTTETYDGDSAATVAYYVTRDGVRQAGPFETESEAYAKLLRVQPMSTDWAMKYEGWDIEESSS